MNWTKSKMSGGSSFGYEAIVKSHWVWTVRDVCEAANVISHNKVSARKHFFVTVRIRREEISFPRASFDPETNELAPILISGIPLDNFQLLLFVSFAAFDFLARIFYRHRVRLQSLLTAWHTFSALRKLFFIRFFIRFHSLSVSIRFLCTSRKVGLSTRSSEHKLIVELFQSIVDVANGAKKLLDERAREKRRSFLALDACGDFLQIVPNRFSSV